MNFKFYIILIAIFAITFTTFAQCNLEVNYKIENYVLDLECSSDFEQPMYRIEIESITGGSGIYSIKPLNGGFISNSMATDGSGFSYYFDETQQQTNNFGFTITDGGNDTCYIDNFVSYQLSSIGFFCSEANCTENIKIDIEPANYNNIFNCNENGDLEIRVSNVFGGDNSFAINTLGLGTIETPNILNNKNFIYKITQSDIDAQQSNIGFLIDDGESCFMRFDFSGDLAFTKIADHCNVLSNNNFTLENEIEIYPNLVKDDFSIKNTSNLKINDFEIYDLNGKLVKSFTYFDFAKYDITDLNSGVYVVLFKANNNLISKKIIKQ